MYHEGINYRHPPFEHQRRGIDRAVEGLTRDHYFAIFMEMGLGKTATTIATARIMIRLELADSLLVICPKALIGTWEQELATHMTEPYELYVWDAQRAKTKTWQEPIRYLLNSQSDPEGVPILIVNVEAFSRPNDVLDRLVKNWYRRLRTVTALDESTFIKTPSSKRTKAVIDYASRSAYRLILTGSEVTNSVLDLYSQFEFLLRGFWKMRNFYAFRARYAILEDIRVAEGRVVKKVVGFRRVDELLSRIEPHTFRALKRNCLDLPDKIYAKIPVRMNREQERIYSELKDELWTTYKGKVLSVPAKVALFIRFRQITGGYMPETGEPIGESNPKIDALLADVEGYAGKVIVWSSFKAELEGVARELNRRTDYQAVSFHGEVTVEEREQSLALFRDDEHTKYLVINPASGAFGLNLQHATLQYNFSRSLSPEKNWQAEDRSHRIGTTESVTYKDLIVPGTVDERILKLLDQKTDLRDRFQTGTVDDILEMV